MEDFIKQLNNLNKIQPSSEWKATARKEILAQISSESSPSPLGIGAEFFYWLKFLSSVFNDFVMRPAGTLLLVFFLVLGGGILKVKADSALPGDFLYSLKRGEEKVQLALVFDDKERATLKLELANRRLEELKKILVQGESTEEKATKALDNFHKDFTLVKENLNNSPQTDIAKQIEDKTTDFQYLLAKTKNNVSKSELNRVLEDVENTNFKALEVIAQSGEEGVGDKINTKIENIRDKAQKQGKTKVLAKLEQAEKDLDKNNFIAALEKVKESREEIDTDVDSSPKEQQVQQDENELVSPMNATSSLIIDIEKATGTEGTSTKKVEIGTEQK